MIRFVPGRAKALFIGLMVLLMVFTLAACAGTPAQPQNQTPQEVSQGSPQGTEETKAPEVPQVSEDPQKLMIPRWFLTSLTLEGQPVEVLPEQQAVTLQFETGGKANGTGGCNDFSTTFQADYDGSMRFGPVVSTKMFCEGSMALENAYLQALSQVEKFSTEDGLVLSSADGKTELVFHMPPK